MKKLKSLFGSASSGTLKAAALMISLFIGLVANAQPQIQWQECYGGTGAENAIMVLQTDDGGYISVGKCQSVNGDVIGNHSMSDDIWVVKFDSAGNIQWQKSLGGTSTEYARSIKKNSSGGYYILGTTRSNNGDVVGYFDATDFWLVKLDSLGNILWQKCLGGTWAEENDPTIQITFDGGCIISGTSASPDGNVTGNHGFKDLWVVKLDSLGNIQWQKAFGGSNWDYACSVLQTFNNKYFVTGYVSSVDYDAISNHGLYDIFIAKINGIGNVEWKKCLGGSLTEIPYSSIQTSDKGFLIVGKTNSNDGNVSGNHLVGVYDIWVVKLDSLGNIQWQKSLGGTSEEGVCSVFQNSHGRYVVLGWTKSIDGDVIGNNGGKNTWMIELDMLGNIYRQKCINSPNGEEPNLFLPTYDGKYIIKYNNDGICKIDTFGNVEWVWSYGVYGDYLYSVQETIDSGYILGGKTSCVVGDIGGDLWIIKLKCPPPSIYFQTNSYGVVNSSVLISEDTTNITVYTNIVGNCVNTITEFCINQCYFDTVTYTKDSTVFFEEQCVTDTAKYTSTWTDTTTWCIMMTTQTIDVMPCGYIYYSQINFDSIWVDNITNEVVDTITTVQVDTIPNYIITTTNIAIIEEITAHLIIRNDSIVTTIGECDNMVYGIDYYYSYAYQDQIFLDTVFYQIPDTIPYVITAEEKFESKLDMRVYPNPFTYELFVQVIGDEIVKVFLYDPVGRLIDSVTGTKFLVLNTARNSNGVYFLKVISKDESLTFRVVSSD